VVVDDPAAVLRPVDQAVGADLVDQPGGAAGEAVDVVDGALGEDIAPGAGVVKMSFDVLADLD
jgi:hypothetical protein